MGVPYYGDFPEDAPVYIPFNTFSSDDPSASVTITNLADTDIYYHKNGSDTDYSADAATLVSINFDGITGNHMCAIDTEENAYFATGSEIAVRMEGTTVDGATINAWIGSFSIERAGGALATAKLIYTAVVTNAAGTDVAADIIAIKSETADIVNDTDLIDDGTSGLAKIASDVADILTDTSSTLDALIKDVPTVAEFEARSDLVGTAATPAEVASALTTYDPPTKTEMDTKIDALNNITAAAVWDATVNESTAGATPTTAKGKLQAIWNRLFTKKTVTATAETSYETDDLTEMEAWALADDDTTASRTR